LTNCLQDAQIILYAESGYVGLESLARLYSAKRETPHTEHFIFSESDWPFAYIPGLYCSLAKRLPWAFSWSYLLDEESDPTVGRAWDQPYLFSFIGRATTHSVRRKVIDLDGPKTPCVDSAGTSTRFDGWDYERSYLEILSRSQFVLCPRGIGTSSVRVFETMRAGRVPVIISDGWIEPPVGDWSRFSIRVPEDGVENIPQICEQSRESATAMGDLARRTFYQYFSPANFLDTTLNFLQEAVGTAPAFGSASLILNAARALSSRELRTVAHRVWNTARSAEPT
jgi:hypothetical protein